MLWHAKWCWTKCVVWCLLAFNWASTQRWSCIAAVPQTCAKVLFNIYGEPSNVHLAILWLTPATAKSLQYCDGHPGILRVAYLYIYIYIILYIIYEYIRIWYAYIYIYVYVSQLSTLDSLFHVCWQCLTSVFPPEKKYLKSRILKVKHRLHTRQKIGVSNVHICSNCAM